MPRLPKPGQDAGQWGQILNTYLSQAHKPDGQLKDNLITENKLSQSLKDKIDQRIGPTGP